MIKNSNLASCLWCIFQKWCHLNKCAYTLNAHTHQLCIHILCVCINNILHAMTCMCIISADFYLFIISFMVLVSAQVVFPPKCLWWKKKKEKDLTGEWKEIGSVETYNSNINVHSWLKDKTGNHGPRPWIEERNWNTDVNKHKAYGCLCRI